jgi:hypothetical protein
LDQDVGDLVRLALLKRREAWISAVTAAALAGAAPHAIGGCNRNAVALPPFASTESPTTPCTDGHQPTDPVDYGKCAVATALLNARSNAVVQVLLAGNPAADGALSAAGVALDLRPESYVIVPAPGATLVVGRDPVGAMYGALDVAERLRDDGAASIPPATPSTAAPAVSFRAANLFLVLPANGETVATWWFRDPSFWTEYLDMMASARLDFLDLHAMYDADTTNFPNALLYFGTSPSFPDVGVPQDDRATNVAMLQQIVQWAAARGIRVGLMSYRSDTSLLGDGNGPALSDSDLGTYTREAVADVARRVPDLARLGFRIGESGHDAAWYAATFVAGVNDAATGVRVYTRTWGTTKPEVLALVAAASEGTIVEAKYNGEHFAAPYAIEGASFATFGSYSYQDYLDPPTPYTFVFQIRAGGTHRIFRFAHFERARRAALSLAMSPRIAGFTFEAAHAYFPQRDFYHLPADKFSAWTFRRDELSYLLMGRLAYDAGTPVSRFRAMLAQRVGTDALWDPLQAASDVVPWIQTALTCGPDQRSYAPELELGGDVGWWAAPAGSNATCGSHVAFDGFSIAMPAEVADDLVSGATTTRLSPTLVAQTMLADAEIARAAAQVPIDPGNAEARDVARECVAVADLGQWFAHKLRAATALAVFQRSAVPEWLVTARSEAALADAAFAQLAADTSYIEPFAEPMRMSPLGYFPFHWRAELPQLADDPAAIDAIASQVAESPPTFTGTLPPAGAWLDAPRADGPGLASLVITPPDPTATSWAVNVTFQIAPPPGASVRVLSKPFSSETDWTAVAASGSDTAWSATVTAAGAGGVFAVEVAGPAGQGWRLPDVLTETPYRVLAP